MNAVPSYKSDTLNHPGRLAPADRFDSSHTPTSLQTIQFHRRGHRDGYPRVHGVQRPGLLVSRRCFVECRRSRTLIVRPLGPWRNRFGVRCLPTSSRYCLIDLITDGEPEKPLNSGRLFSWTALFHRDRRLSRLKRISPLPLRRLLRFRLSPDIVLALREAIPFRTLDFATDRRRRRN